MKKSKPFGNPLPIMMILGLFLLLPTAVNSTIWVHLYPTKDAFVDSAHPDTNYGSSTDLFTGEVDGYKGHEHTAFYLHFDLGAAIPAGSTILSAELYLWLHECAPSYQSRDVSIYFIGDEWHESTITYSTAPSPVAIPPLATLSHSCSSTDYLYWDITYAIVDAFYAGGAFDCTVKIEDPPIGTWDNYHSREQIPMPDYRPYLEISYEAPPPPVFVHELGVSHESETLYLNFTIGTPVPVTWAVYLILTFPSVQVIPLWTFPLPAIEPPVDIPVSFSFPSIGWIGIWSGLLTEEGVQAYELLWVYT